MGKLIENVVAHFTGKERRSLFVPEWDTTVFAKNLTVADKSAWTNRAEGDTTRYILFALIFGLTDEAGEPVFGIEDLPALKTKADEKVITRLFDFVNADAGKTDEEREKN